MTTTGNYDYNIYKLLKTNTKDIEDIEFNTFRTTQNTNWTGVKIKIDLIIFLLIGVIIGMLITGLMPRYRSKTWKGIFVRKIIKKEEVRMSFLNQLTGLQVYLGLMVIMIIYSGIVLAVFKRRKQK